MRGYSKSEVDEFLDDIIKDYETYAALVKRSCVRENRPSQGRELAAKPVESTGSADSACPINTSDSVNCGNFPQMTSATNLIS